MSAATPSPKPGILDIELYVGGRSAVPGVSKVYKLSSNESPLGPSPKALDALAEAARELVAYPEPSSRILREAVAEAFGLDASRVVCGGDGSDELLTFMANAYVRADDEVIFTEHAFSLYRIATLANSGKPVVVKETNLCADVDAMLAAVTPKTRLVYLANPNNPTGSYINEAELNRLHAGLSSETILVIDAAYAEFVTAKDYESGLSLAKMAPNVVMTRTFSKAYGLAGLRVGWLYGSAKNAEILNKIRGPFNLSMMQQKAAAAALKDQAHLRAAIDHNSKWRPWLIEEIRKIGLRADDSQTNFILIHFPMDKNAQQADDFLMARGLILRGVASYGLADCLRLSVGSEEANRKVVAALRDFMEQK
jgi:histidinol-phosphate aminotransferase